MRTPGQHLKRKARKALQATFLETYAMTGLQKPPRVNAICQDLQIARATFYKWLEQDSRFAANYLALQSVFYLPWCLAVSGYDKELAKERALYRHLQRKGKQLIQAYQTKGQPQTAPPQKMS